MQDFEIRNLGSLDLSTHQLDQAQSSFIKLDNFHFYRQRGIGVKRGGSIHYDATGDIIGLGGYAVNNSGNFFTPITDIPLALRYDNPTYYFEKYDWLAGSWSAITQGSNVAFSNAGVASFAQIGDLLCVCGGKPAKITNISSGNIERLGGDAPTTPSAATGSAGSLTGDYYYVVTFYDSTTGWESSPSTLTSVVSPSSEEVDLSSIPTTSNRDGVDKVKIYRTIATGEQPFLYVNQVNLGTSTYTDDLVDASLGTPAPSSGDQDAPPTTSFVCAVHENRLWIASENILYYSKAFNDNEINLEYFSEDRKFIFDFTITGLAPRVDGGLLVFNSPGFGIHEIIGRNSTEFESRTVFAKEGTNFHSSITVKDSAIAYWANGPRIITGGQVNTNLELAVREYYRDTLDIDLENAQYIWSVWDEARDAIIWGIGVEELAEVAWKNSSTGITTRWLDGATPVGWDRA